LNICNSCWLDCTTTQIKRVCHVAAEPGVNMFWESRNVIATSGRLRTVIGLFTLVTEIRCLLLVSE